jgi:hypothetical protein
MPELEWVGRSSEIKKLSELIKALVTQSGCCREVEPGTNRYLCFCDGSLKRISWSVETILTDEKYPGRETYTPEYYERLTGKKFEQASEETPDRVVIDHFVLNIVKRDRLTYWER